MSVDISDNNKGHQQRYLTAPHLATETDETRKLLKRMCRLMEDRARREKERRYQDDKEDEMKNEWTLAAAVLDRISKIVIIIIYVVGTVMLFVLFATHPDTHS